MTERLDKGEATHERKTQKKTATRQGDGFHIENLIS